MHESVRYGRGSIVRQLCSEVGSALEGVCVKVLTSTSVHFCAAMSGSVIIDGKPPKAQKWPVICDDGEGAKTQIVSEVTISPYYRPQLPVVCGPSSFGCSK